MVQNFYRTKENNGKLLFNKFVNWKAKGMLEFQISINLFLYRIEYRIDWWARIKAARPSARTNLLITKMAACKENSYERVNVSGNA